MSLRHRGFVDLPTHVKTGGFDHAAVHERTGRIYVAHTANDAVDIIDTETQKYVSSITGLTAVAGALVTTSPDLVFTSNRGENTVAIVRPDGGAVEKIPVGLRPNGLAYDPSRGRLLAAHVGDPAIPGSCTVSIVDIHTRKRIVDDIPVAGRTRWTVYDPIADVFHVNIADPPQIVVVSAGDPIGIRRTVPIPHAGPHGLDIDVVRRRLFCACDDGMLVEIDADRGSLLASERIAGPPDVVFFNSALSHLYVAIGDPGVIDVFGTAPLRRRETITTEAGAHTLSFDTARNLVCAFLPETHRAAVYDDKQ